MTHATLQVERGTTEHRCALHERSPAQPQAHTH